MKFTIKGKLALLTEEILPAAEEALKGKPEYRVLAGYSLAGLFAVYASYRTDAFAGIVSVSGSFWFPRFLEYVKEQEMRRIPEKMYFSLGDKEAFTKNPYLSSVEERTKMLYEYYLHSGIPATFARNPGNHFQKADWRMANGIQWILGGNDKIKASAAGKAGSAGSKKIIADYDIFWE